MDTYDAGLLNDYGGGDVGWWQDYLRAELGRAEEFYRNQHDSIVAEKDAEIAAARDKALEDAATLANNRIRRWLEIEPPYNGDLDEAIALIEELPAAIRAMIAAQREDGTW